MIGRILGAILILGLIVWGVRLLVIAAIALLLIAFVTKPKEMVMSILILMMMGLIIAQPLLGIALLITMMIFNSVMAEKA